MTTLFGGAAGAVANNTVGDLKNDIAIANPPEDSITELSFNPSVTDVKDFLAVSSWDKRVRVYEILSSGQAEGRVMYEHSAPVFSCDFSKDCKRVVSAGADNQARLCDLETGKTEVVAQHGQAIRKVRFFDVDGGSQMVVTGSWDKTIRYWDLRTSPQAAVATVQCQERVYCMDVKDNLLVAGTADRYINIINLKDPTKIYKTLQSPLKWQTRVVKCFNNSAGFAIGSIEGRCAIQYVEDKDANSNFSFRCHRDPVQNNNINVHTVNDISFHPIHGTFSTAGSDGTFHFWDKDAKHRLKGYPQVGNSISAAQFSRNGNIFAYAVSYDWSKGYQANTPQLPTKIMLHPVMGDECKPRPSVKKR